jgi:hypothetical protein
VLLSKSEQLVEIFERVELDRKPTDGFRKESRDADRILSHRDIEMNTPQFLF